MSLKRSVLLITTFALSVGAGIPAWSYDANLAASYAKLFEPAARENAGKGLHCMKPEAFMNKVKGGEPMLTLDVRTEAETQILGSALPDSLRIPLNELFQPANLQRIPTDRMVVVLCKSGIRAAAAATALRHLGFDRVFILQGGYKALNDYLDPLTAHSPPVAHQPKP